MLPDPVAPFLTVFNPLPEMSLSDLEAEITRLNQRNQAIEGMLKGELPPSVLFDHLAEDGIEPDEWIEVSIDNCLYIANV